VSPKVRQSRSADNTYLGDQACQQQADSWRGSAEPPRRPSSSSNRLVSVQYSAYQNTVRVIQKQSTKIRRYSPPMKLLRLVEPFGLLPSLDDGESKA